MNKVNRRQIIHAGCIATAVTLAPRFLDKAEAIFHRGAASTPSGFNGGRSQTNFSYIWAGDYPFINMMKAASLAVFGDFSANTVTPDILDADGYPTSIVNGGLYWAPTLPSQTERPGNYLITWDGTGSIIAGGGGLQLGTATFTGSISGNVLAIPGSVTGTIQLGQRVTGGTTLPYTFIMNQIDATHYTLSKSQTVTSVSMTADGGSSSSSGGAGAGFFACTVTASAIVFRITAIGSSSNRITNVNIYHADDAARVAAGEVFGTEFLRRIREANFGVLRFLNWQDGNTTNVTTWRTRKPQTYVTYQGYQLNNDYYAGVTSNSGNAYSTVTGPTGTGFPAFHSSDGTAWTSGGPKHGDTVHIKYNASATASGTVSFSVGGSGAINILSAYCGPLSANSAFYPSVANGSQTLATLVYSAVLTAWIAQGGNADQGSVGIHNVVPPELMFRLCKEVGAHPYFITPPLSIAPAMDYMPNVMWYGKTYAAANATWMIPRFEGPNELWNFGAGFYQTSYANAVSAILWSGGNFMDWYGYQEANLGQMSAQIYGGGLGTSYHLICGVQTHGGLGSSDERLASSKYIAQAAASDASLTGPWGTITFAKTAAKFVTSHIANAQYISPAERFSIDELRHAFAWSVTNKGNPSAQATIANNYCDTLTGSSSTPFTLGYCNTAYVSWKGWAAGFGVNKMCGYEGAWSPDFLGAEPGFPNGTAWWSFPTGRTQTNPAIIQLTSACSNREVSPGTIPGGGNPGVAGMTVTFFGTGTAFDNPGLQAVTIAGSNSANISGANTLLVNQAVYFVTDGTLPNELSLALSITQSQSKIRSEAYYVVSAGNPFQISATRGGSPILFNSTGSNLTIQECWFISGVDDINSRVTLDVNSTGFSAPTGGFMTYSNSQIYSNNLRQAGKLSPNLQGYIYGSTSPASSYKSYIDAGGEFPSNYLMGGPYPSLNVWNVLEPLSQSPNPPQWLAFIAFNH